MSAHYSSGKHASNSSITFVCTLQLGKECSKSSITIVCTLQLRKVCSNSSITIVCTLQLRKVCSNSSITIVCTLQLRKTCKQQFDNDSLHITVHPSHIRCVTQINKLDEMSAIVRINVIIEQCTCLQHACSLNRFDNYKYTCMVHQGKQFQNCDCLHSNVI